MNAETKRISLSPKLARFFLDHWDDESEVEGLPFKLWIALEIGALKAALTSSAFGKTDEGRRLVENLGDKTFFKNELCAKRNGLSKWFIVLLPIKYPSQLKSVWRYDK